MCSSDLTLFQTCTSLYSRRTITVLQDSPADSARHVSFTPIMAAEYILKCAYKQARMWVCYSVSRAVTSLSVCWTLYCAGHHGLVGLGLGAGVTFDFYS